MASAPLRWGIISTGKIARTLADAIRQSRTGELLAVGSRRQETAAAFGAEFDVPRRYGSYDALLADPDVDVVYNALPNHLHAEWTIKAAQAGKHILCEKPLATNLGQAMALVEAARYHDVFLLEAFMYRCHPQTAKLVELIQAGAVGEVRLIQASFTGNIGLKLDNIRLQNGAAGGSLMDLGCYTMSMARLIAGAALGQEVAEPLDVKGCAWIGTESRVDQVATAALRFPGDIVASLICGNQCASERGVRVWGSEGMLEVPNPWFPQERDNEIIVTRSGEQPEKVIVHAEQPLYVTEVDTVAAHLAARQAPSPCMTWDDSLGQQDALDRWRESIGLVFDEERDEAALRQTVSKQPLRRRPSVSPTMSMRYGRVAGIEQDVSRLVLGTMIYHPDRQSFTNAVLDYFFELGGNCFDTAFSYRGGFSEPALGNWIRQRNIREQVVVVTKGGHHASVTPDMIDHELPISLERLRTDYIDLYFLHRDNPAVPVGEFVDMFNRHRAAGRVRAFGGSNWTPARLAEANAYAEHNGLAGFSASSPNFTLAVWNEVPYFNCVTATDPASKAWYAEHQFPLFAWSSQAMGFFTGRYHPDDRSNDLVVRTWYSDDNWQRYKRAQELGRRKGVAATQIAVAYVLAQPFPTFALVGPHTIEETRTTALGLSVSLTPEEVAWLNLEA
ncbi:MAG: aldo/keto reductase [Chloroflexota bacterium]|nr:aldo/keto reductase [Chloroflexota bacterium]